MILTSQSRKWILSIAFMTLAACGSNHSDVSLPDDPSDEQTVLPGDDNTTSDVTEIAEGFPEIDKATELSILSKYDYIDQANLIADRLLKPALIFYDTNKSKLKNSQYLTVIDFSLHSSQKRMFIINMSNGQVWAMRVAHGKGSDPNHDGYLNSFSNSSGSNATSQGFYRAAETYNGSNGYSLRLDGLSSTNSQARSRAIVIHGASYVQESNVKQGRSWGCPAVAMENRDRVINMLKGGSIIYANK